jgi:hypothetical protein
MAEIPVPAKFGFTRVEQFGLMRGGRTVRSRYTGSRQTIVLPYALWTFSGTLIEYPEAEAAPIRAFLAALRGQANTFVMRVPGWVPVTANMNNPNVDFKVYGGGSVAGTNTMGVLVSGPGVVYDNIEPLIPVGSFFTVNNELKIVTKVIEVAGIDVQQIEFEPPLRTAAAHLSLIYVRNPYCIMNAVDDDVASWALQAPVIHNFQFKAIESF